jgi:hypothetical protein
MVNTVVGAEGTEGVSKELVGIFKRLSTPLLFRWEKVHIWDGIRFCSGLC